MIRTQPGTFRTAQGDNRNVTDDVNGDGATRYRSIHSLGGMLIDQLPLAPAQNQRWSVLALSVIAYLQLVGTTNISAFGRFGKIMTGLVPPPEANPTTSLNRQIPWVSLSMLPADPTLVTTLWDPANDTLPPYSVPNVSPPGNTLPVSAVIQLPQPLDLNPGETPGMGLWMLPMLLGSPSLNWNLTMNVQLARYTLVYDDHL